MSENLFDIFFPPFVERGILKMSTKINELVFLAAAKLISSFFLRTSNI